MAGTDVDLARSIIGMIVRKGAAKPDIRTVDGVQGDAPPSHVGRRLQQHERCLSADEAAFPSSGIAAADGWAKSRPEALLPSAGEKRKSGSSR